MKLFMTVAVALLMGAGLTGCIFPGRYPKRGGGPPGHHKAAGTTPTAGPATAGEPQVHVCGDVLKSPSPRQGLNRRGI